MRPARPRHKSARVLLGAMCAGIIAALAFPTGAHAAPSPAEIEAQIDQKWNELEPLIEKHNGVKVDLADKQAKADGLANQIRPLQLQVDLAMGRVSSISAQAYKNGQASTLNALLTSSSPNSLAAQLATLDAMAKSEQSQVADAAKAKGEYDKQKKPLDDLVKQLTATEQQLASQEKSIQDQINQYQKMRLDAYGTTQGTGSLRTGACPSSYDGSIGAKAAQIACAQIGKAYVFGAEGPGNFDCSGLTKWAWSQATGGRVNMYHYTNTQYSSTKHITQAQAKAGDLVFFFNDLHHVGMYVGNGMMVNAPHSGDVVRMAPITQMPVAGFTRPG
jgi:cell wall-associated NlpC family hydrolase